MKQPVSPALSRRTLLRGALAAGVARSLPSSAQPRTAQPTHLLLAGNAGRGLYRATWNAATGEIGPLELAIDSPNVTFMVRHPRLPVLYVCNEGSGAAANVSAFKLERQGSNPSLTLLATRPSLGNGPCHAAVDRTGRLLCAANYSGGSFAAYHLDAAGIPSPGSGFSCVGNSFCGPLGSQADRQDAPHLHCATFSPDDHFVLSCDLGDDAILVFPLHLGETRPLCKPQRIAVRAGSGPRHLAFHPNGRWLYCIHELDCTVDLFHWQVTGGNPSLVPVPQSTVSVRSPHPPAKPASTAAEIVITGDGRFLYTSTRFADVLNVFAITPGSGLLQPVEQLPCGGKTPRFFALDPTERFLLCCNQDSDSVCVFQRDPASGRLQPTHQYKATNPMCALWV